ncbi:MAG TPA: hypothetical protein VKB56_07580 [Terriglobales bacterium]|nr:hypothetical protein [Terriglobales bacterium]
MGIHSATAVKVGNQAEAAMVETGSAEARPHYNNDVRRLTVAAAALSIVAFFIYFRRGDLLLSGDAVAHINHARRVFDSLTPGLGQLGTVWLPLPHLLMLPFVANDWLWRSGVAGAIPSMTAFVLGVLGIFRLVSEAALGLKLPAQGPRASGWLAVALYGANPNLLYLQTTANNEPLYLALFIWSMVWLQRFRQRLRNNRPDNTIGRALVACGVLIAAAELTRYDGWFVAGCTGMAASAILLLHRRKLSPRMLLASTAFAATIIAAPAFWLAYNYALQGNPLDFADGPYSAHAIELRSPHGPGRLHPGDHEPRVAAAYYIRTAEADLGQNKERYLIFWIALVSAVILALARTEVRLLILLWAPLPFYIYSIAYGSIPVFMPELPPWSYYNTRYGTAVLPAIAAFLALAVALIAARSSARLLRAGIFLVAFVFATLTYVSAYRMPHHRGWSFPGEPNAGPLVWREAKTNAVTRAAFESELGIALQKLPAHTRLLMYCSNHVGALQQAGIPLRNVINEANHPFWQWALAAPAKEADFVVAITGDPIAAAVLAHPDQLVPVVSIRGASDQGDATIYRSLVRPTPEPD